MDYQLTQEESRMQQDAAAFCRENISERAKSLDACPHEEACRCMKDNLRSLSAGGFLDAGMSGEGIDLVRNYIVGEEIASACASTYLSVAREHLPVRRGHKAVRN
jgi:alkylation response protein AidB-like acyl-CoA dehydrogenase